MRSPKPWPTAGDRTSKINGEINEKMSYYREQTKPQVNLTALYPDRFAGVVLPPGRIRLRGFGPLTSQLNELSRWPAAALPPSRLGVRRPAGSVGNYGHSLARFGTEIFRHGIELNISLPLRNRTADANLGKSCGRPAIQSNAAD